jgi:hypothetical protein
VRASWAKLSRPGHPEQASAAREGLFLRTDGVALFLPLSTVMKTAWMAWAAVMAAAAMIPLGCGSVQIDPDPQPAGCPTVAPKAGEKCSVAATGCAYTAGPCDVELSCKAANDVWKSSTTSCMPAAADCWSAQEGDVCAVVGDACGEGDGPCGEGFSSTCGEDHHWHIASIGGDDCPPPVSDYCISNGTQATCETDPACRWLTPGCGDFPLAAPGCFTTTDCNAAGCEPGTMCTQVSFNPCFGQNCDACGAETALCFPVKQ